MNRLLFFCSAVFFLLPDAAVGQKAPSNITIGKIDSIWSPTLKEQRPIWI